MHTNTYAATGDHVIDSSGKAWATEEAHPWPPPRGIDPDRICGEVTTNARGLNARWFPPEQYPARALVDYWLVRRPLPAPPRVNTQKDKDAEAFSEWAKRQPIWNIAESVAAEYAWRAALAYARSKGDSI